MVAASGDLDRVDTSRELLPEALGLSDPLPVEHDDRAGGRHVEDQGARRGRRRQCLQRNLYVLLSAGGYRHGPASWLVARGRDFDQVGTRREFFSEIVGRSHRRSIQREGRIGGGYIQP